MRAIAAFSAALLVCWLTGCGYVGPVLPPSPQLPPAVTDLKVIERAGQIQISFTVPARTTDNLPINQYSQIDLRIGPASRPFDFETWAGTATKIEVQPPPEAADRRTPAPASISKSIPALEWVGRQVEVAVRASVRRNGHFSAWSNVVRLNIIMPLAAPDVQASATASGVLLNWNALGSDIQYRVYRQTSSSGERAQIGTAKTAEYLDATAQFDTAYRYTVVAFRESAESLPSQPKDITPLDKFPPSVPASITALAAPETVEVTWQRSPEADLKGYNLFRSVNGAPFEQVGGLLSIPAYSDHAVEHGKSYRYEVSAVDQKNNRSDESALAEARF